MSYLPKGMAVSNFLMRLGQIKPEDCPEDSPWADFSYGAAIETWEAEGKDPAGYYSTSDDWLLQFRTELQAEFGLRIVSHEEAVEIHRASKLDELARGLDKLGGPFDWGIKEGKA